MPDAPSPETAGVVTLTDRWALLRGRGYRAKVAGVVLTALLGIAGAGFAARGWPEEKDLLEWAVIGGIPVIWVGLLGLWMWYRAEADILRARVIDREATVRHFESAQNDSLPKLHAVYPGPGFGWCRTNATGMHEGLLITIPEFRITNRSTTHRVQLYFILTVRYGDVLIAYDSRQHSQHIPAMPSVRDPFPDTIDLAPGESKVGTLRFYSQTDQARMDLETIDTFGHHLQAADLISGTKRDVSRDKRPLGDDALSRRPGHYTINADSGFID